MTAPTLAELGRVMNEDPREMAPEVKAWAIGILEHRLTLIPEGTPAHARYALRLHTLEEES